MKLSRLFFRILFPLIVLIIGFILVFYLDLANGPLRCFILELIAIAAYVVVRIIFRNKKIAFRIIPLAGFILANAIILPLAHPTIISRLALDFNEYEKTEVLKLKDGDIQGVYNKDKSVEIYAGIPYAKPPIGELRWKEPQDVEKWSGVKDCSYFAPKSMQPNSNPVMNTLVDMYAEKGWHPNWNMIPEQNKSEDSLYLNIWKPHIEKTDLPILIYIHGGSLTNGTSAFNDYNGEEMAKKEVIMITIQYRLGVFGFFAHEDLINESPNHTTGNYGLLDQIKALKWVNDNATYFGGDKNNITIAGESAGSSSISAICSSPLAKGLFRRAIGESSSLVVKKPPHTFRKMSEALETGQNIMKEQNCKSIEELRKIKAEDLVNTKFANTSMTLDGYALTKTPYETYLAHENNEEALLNGYNVKESDAFVVPKFLLTPTNKDNILARLESYFNKETARKMYDLYEDKIEKDAFSAFNEIISVYWFIGPHYSWSKLALNNGVNVYKYQFTKENGYYGTYHSGEMIYCYGNVKKSPYGYRYNESDIKLSEIMLSYWSNFAKYGDPNGEKLPVWPLFNEDNSVMELGENVGPIGDKYIELYDIIDEYIDWSISQETL